MFSESTLWLSYGFINWFEPFSQVSDVVHGPLALIFGRCLFSVSHYITDNIYLFVFLLEENPGFHKSSPFVSFFGNFGYISPWLELRSCLSLLKVLLQVSGGPLSFTIGCPWDCKYLCAFCCPFSIHVPIISTLINNCTILISGICCVKLYTLMVKGYTETFRRGTFITVSEMPSAENMENME